MKEAFFLCVLACTVTAASAQTKKPDHLLWYKGKLIKPNVLLTETGDTVFYTPQKRQVKVVSKSGTGKQLDRMFAELNNSSKRIDAAVQKIKQIAPRYLWADLSNAVDKAFSSVTDEWKPMLGNTITLPEGDPAFASSLKSAIGKGGTFHLTEAANPWEENRYEELLKKFRAFREKHKEDNPGLLPVPPRYDFSYCFPCDSIAQDRYDKEVRRFVAEVSATDTEIMNEALQFSAYMQKGIASGLFDEDANNETWDFIHFLLKRGASRAALLLEKYEKDAARLPAILNYVLPVHRQLQLMGETSNPTALTGLNYFDKVFATLHDHFSTAMKEKDYAVALNIHFMLKLERERQILGQPLNGDQNLIEQYLHFNQFKLNSNITAKLGQDDKYIAGHVRGDNWFYALPDVETCRLNWILASKTTDRTAKYKLLAAEFGGAPVKYVGTKEWQSQPPIIKMDFCYVEGKKVTDSILANSFHPEGFREQWHYPEPAGVMEVENLSAALTACFLDVNRTNEEAEKLSKEMMEKKSQELQAKYVKMMQSNPGAARDLSIKMQADVEKLTREIKETMTKMNPLNYVFTPQVNTKTKEVLKERLDGKEIFPENAAIVYAWFHLTMEHDPEGPHRIPSMLSLFSIK
jgi:hypothetical protein